MTPLPPLIPPPPSPSTNPYDPLPFHLMTPLPLHQKGGHKGCQTPSHYYWSPKTEKYRNLTAFWGFATIWDKICLLGKMYRIIIYIIRLILFRFFTHWDYAIISITLCYLIYKYVEWKGCILYYIITYFNINTFQKKYIYRAKKEWGDGIRGLALTTAQYSLMQIPEKDPHPKNWRPQLLL